MTTHKILVPVDFTPCSDAALDYALAVADECGAEVEVLHVWRPREAEDGGASAIFADTPEGVAMEQRLTAAASDHPARVCGRLEFGEEPSSVIVDIAERERFDLVVMGLDGDGGHVNAHVARTAKCKVVTRPPPPLSSPPDGARSETTLDGRPESADDETPDETEAA
jgi:nucleotide-binding universal stress UspA family protein